MTNKEYIYNLVNNVQLNILDKNSITLYKEFEHNGTISINVNVDNKLIIDCTYGPTHYLNEFSIEQVKDITRKWNFTPIGILSICNKYQQVYLVNNTLYNS